MTDLNIWTFLKDITTGLQNVANDIASHYAIILGVLAIGIVAIILVKLGLQ